MIEVRQEDHEQAARYYCAHPFGGTRDAELTRLLKRAHAEDIDALSYLFAAHRQQAEDAMRERVDDLRLAAKRVDRKYGHYEDGEPCDWSEWQDLRTAIRGIDAGGEDQADPSG